MSLFRLLRSALRPFSTHPALAFASVGAVESFHLEGFDLLGRTRNLMSIGVLAQRRVLSGRMILRAMRNLIIGLIVFLVVGNAAIFVAFQAMSRTGAAQPLPDLPSIENLHSVDAKVWRGSAPAAEGYAALADQGVKTIVDLRAEDLKVDEAYINSLGMELVRIPMRDGQAPTEPQVEAFLTAVKNTDGLVYLHCGAGVGRTGTMAAAYLVMTGQASAMEALQRNLAVGPPSLEQIAFAASLDAGEEVRSNPLFMGLSRVLDAPRRILVRLRNSYGH